MLEDSLLHTRRRTDVLRCAAAGPEVHPRPIRQIRARETASRSPRCCKESGPVIAYRLSGVVRCRQIRSFFGIHDGVHLEVVLGTIDVQIALIVAVHHDATIAPSTGPRERIHLERSRPQVLHRGMPHDRPLALPAPSRTHSRRADTPSAHHHVSRAGPNR